MDNRRAAPTDFSQQNSTPSDGNADGRITCDHCGGYGHSRDLCLQMRTTPDLSTGTTAHLPLSASQVLLFCSFCGTYCHTNDQCVTCGFCYEFVHTENQCPHEIMHSGEEIPVVSAAAYQKLSVQPTGQFVQPPATESHANLTQTRAPQHIVFTGSQLIDATLYYSGIPPYSQGNQQLISV